MGTARLSSAGDGIQHHARQHDRCTTTASTATAGGAATATSDATGIAAATIHRSRAIADARLPGRNPQKLEYGAGGGEQLDHEQSESRSGGRSVGLQKYA